MIQINGGTIPCILCFGLKNKIIPKNNTMKKTIFLPFLIFVTMTAFSLSAQELKFSTLDWEPYIGQNLDGQGFVAEIVKTAFQRGGYHKIKLIFYPWARTIRVSQKGKVDGYLPEYYDQSIEEHHYFSEPFPGGPLVFFKLKSRSEISYNSLQDLKPYTIGVVRGYVNTKEFDDADFLKKEEVTYDLLNLKKLLAGRIDLIVIDKYVGLHLLNTKLPDKKQKIDIINPPLGINDLYVCFSKKNKNARKLRDAFNSGLKKIKNDGTLLRILKKRGF